jgi:hypothetical protein
MSEPKLFTMVKCKAYLKKAHDGVFIEFEDKYGIPIMNKTVDSPDAKAFAWKLNPDTLLHEVIKDLGDWCGDSVEKTYRERIEEEFTGCVVGYTRINVKGRIGTDWECDSYCGEYGHCFKEITEYPKVAVVYFKNNVKRYVLPEDMEEVKKDGSNS